MPPASQKQIVIDSENSGNSGNSEEFLRLYESRARGLPLATEAAQMLCRGAQVAREKLKDLAKSERLYRRAVFCSPGSREALEGLRTIYELRGDDEKLAMALVRLGRQFRGNEAAQAYLRAGQIYAEKLDLPGRAVLLYRLAARAAPTERKAYQYAQQVLLAEERYAAAFAVLESERAQFGDRGLAEAYLKIASALVDHPREHELATRAIQRVREFDPNNPRAAACAQAMADLPQVWREKVKEYQARSLAERNKRLAARSSLRAALLVGFYEPTSIEAMKEAIDRCLALWPAMPEVLELFEHLAKRTGDNRAAQGVLRKLAKEEKEPRATGDILLRLGQLLLQEPDGIERALAVFQEICTLSPSRVDASLAATELLIQLGRAEEARKLLEATASAADEKHRARILKTLAELALETLSDPTGAARYLEEAAKLDPDDVELAWRLCELLVADKQLDRLWPHLDTAILVNRPVSVRAALCESISAQCIATGNFARATTSLALGISLEPDRKNFLPALVRAGQKANLNDVVLETIDAVVPRLPKALQLEFLKTKGKVLEGVGRNNDARETWRQVRTLAPDDPQAREALSALEAARAEEKPDAKREPRSELDAEIRRLEESGADPTLIAAAYRKLLVIEPGSVSALKRLGALAVQLAAWEEVVSVVERLVALVSTQQERQEWKLRLAQVYAERVDRPEDATQLYLNLVEEGVTSSALIAALERLAARGIRSAEVSRALAPLYAKAGDFQRQVASLLVQLASENDRGEQLKLLALLAETSEQHLSDPRAAFDFRLRALKLDPLDTNVRMDAHRLSRSLSSERELAQVLAQEAQEAKPALAVELFSEAADLSIQANAFDDAVSALKGALVHDAQNRELLSRMVDAAEKASRIPELSQALRALISTSDPNEQVQLWLKLEAASSTLNRPAEAAEALSKAIAAGAPAAEHLPRLAKRLEELGRWAELLPVLEKLEEHYREVGNTDELERLSATRREMQERALGGRSKALQAFAARLAEKPNDTQALEGLEAMLSDTTIQDQASRALAKAYEALGESRKLVSVLAILAKSSRDQREQVTSLVRAAKLHSSVLRQPGQAYSSLAEALRLMPDAPDIRQAVRAAAEEASAFDTYALELERLIKNNAPGLLGVHEELADVYERKLNQRDAAIRHLDAVVAIDPKHIVALKALRRLNRARENWPALVVVVERLAALEQDPVERTALYAEAATVYEHKLSDLEHAAENWRKIVARDPKAREPAVALARIYGQLERPPELAFALELLRNQEGSTPKGRELACRLGVLRRTSLSDAPGALELFRQVLSEDPAHRETREALATWIKEPSEFGGAAMRMLDEALDVTKEHSPKIALREARLAVATDPDERSKLLRELAALYDRDGRQPARAFEVLSRAFMEGYDRESLRTDLERLAALNRSSAELAEMYEGAGGDTDADPDERMTFLRRAAELRQELGAPEVAAQNWKQLLEISPNDAEALSHLGQIYETSNNARSLAEVHEKQAEVATNAEERRFHYLKAAGALEASGQDERAIFAYQAALKIERSVEILAGLERIFERLHRTPEQAKVLEELGKVSEKAEDRLRYTLSWAELLLRSGENVQSLKAFEKVLKLSPGNAAGLAGVERLIGIHETSAEAARILEPRYRELKDARRLAEVLELRVAGLDQTARATTLKEIASLQETAGNKLEALRALSRAVVDAPQDADVRTDLERLALELGAFEELAESYREIIAKKVDPKIEAELWRQLAPIYSDRLGRADEAMLAWQHVLEQDPNDTKVLARLAQMHKKASQFKELAAIMERQLHLEQSPTTQLNILFELATLADDILSDKALAARCYENILERRPDSESAMKHLTRILTEMERWDELARRLQSEAVRVRESGRVEQSLELLVRLGRLQMKRLGDNEGALSTLKEVLALRPNHAAAIGALEDMANSDSPLKGEAAKALEPVFAREGDFHKQAQMLEARIASEEAAETRAELAWKLAELYSRELENPELAFTSALRAFEESPQSEAQVELLVDLATKASALEALAEGLHRAVSKVQDSAVARALWLARGQALETLGDMAGAADCWRFVLAEAPRDPVALERLDAALSHSGATDELREVLRARIETEPPDRLELVLRLGELELLELDDQHSALETYRLAHEIDPENKVALEALIRLTERFEQWSELAQLLERRLAVADGPERSTIAVKLGALLEQRLRKPARAVPIYAKALEDDPQNTIAAGRLEAMVAENQGNAEAAAVLITTYRRRKDFGRLGTLLASQVSILPSGKLRRDALFELARLQALQGDREAAYLSFYRSYQEDPNWSESRREFIALGAALGNFEEVASSIEAEYPNITDPQVAAESAIELGELYSVRLGEPERAAQFYAQVRGNEAYAPRVMPILEQLYEQAGDTASQVDVLEESLRYEAEPQKRIATLLRMGSIFADRLDEPGKAVAAYEDILASDPEHLGALRALVKLYEKAGASEQLAAALDKLKPLVDGPEAESVLVKLAGLTAETDSDEAAKLYQGVLETNPRNQEAFGGLAQVLSAAERNEELEELLAWRLSFSTDTKEQLRLHEWLGRLRLTTLGKPEEATTSFKAVLDRDPRNVQALEALRTAYGALGKRDELIAILRRSLPVLEDPVEVRRTKIRIAMELAEIPRREESLDLARKTLEAGPHAPEDLDALKGVFARLGAWNDAASALAAKSHYYAELDDLEHAIAAQLEIGELWENEVQRPELAAPAFEKVLDIDPANRDAFERAKTVYASLNDWRAYTHLVERFIPQFVTNEEKVAALKDVAEIQEQRLDSKTGAFMNHIRALELVPEDTEVLAAAERLADETESYEEFALALEQVLEKVPRGITSVALHVALARIQDQKLDDPTTAEASLRNVLALDPSNQAALSALADIFARHGQGESYVRTLDKRLEAAVEPEERVGILLQLARAHEEQMQDPKRAESMLEQALEVAPSIETYKELVALCERQADAGGAGRAYLRAAELPTEPTERAALLRSAGTSFEVAEQVEDAIHAYRQAVETVPEDLAAIEALERLYLATDQPAELLDIYNRHTELAEDPAKKLELLGASAHLWWERFENLENAEQCARLAVDVAPEDPTAHALLAEVLFAQGRGDDLVETLKRQLQLSHDAQTQSHLWVSIANAEEKLRRALDQAVEALQHALELDPQNVQALHALGGLYERTGNWPFAIETWERAASIVEGTPEAAEYYAMMARIHEEMLSDTASAQRCYEQALAVAPGMLPALRGLRQLYEQQENWEGYEQTLVDEANYSIEGPERCAAWIQAGNFYLQQERRDPARNAFEEAYRNDPTSLQAASALADIYYADEAWEKCEQMLDFVVDGLRQNPDESQQLCQRLYRLGYVAQKTDNDNKALEVFEEAWRIDATYLLLLESYGSLLMRVGRPQEALRIFQSILAHHRSTLAELEVGELYCTIGTLLHKLGQVDRATNHFEKALEFSKNHEESLRALVGIHEKAGRWDLAVEYGNRLLRVCAPESRFDIGVAIGAMARDKLKDPHLAIEAFQAAHRARPEMSEILDVLFALYQETKQGGRAVEILEHMLTLPELQDDPERAKRAWVKVGELARDAMGDPERAAQAFNQALDIDWRLVDAFSGMERMLGSNRLWGQLEENYKRMIARIPKDDETHGVRMALWRSLGELYQNALQNPEAAFAAYQVAAKGLPQDGELHQRLALVAQSLPDHKAEALAAWRGALRAGFSQKEALAAIAESAARAKQLDLAWMAAQVSSGLTGEVGTVTKEILARLSGYARLRENPQFALTEDLWRKTLYHPQLNPYLAEVLAILGSECRSHFTEDPAKYGFNPKKHLIDMARAQEFQLKPYMMAARLLGMDSVPVFSPFLASQRERISKRTVAVAPDPTLSIDLCHIEPPAVRLGGRFFAMTVAPELLYASARTLSLLRPEFILTQRMAPERLGVLVQAAISLAVDRYRFTAPTELIQTDRVFLEKVLSPQKRDVLARACQALSQRVRTIELAPYYEGMEYTVTRVGAIVAGYLEPVKRMVSAETGPNYRVPVESRLNDLAAFAVSDECMHLRAAIGVDIQIQVKK